MVLCYLAFANIDSICRPARSWVFDFILFMCGVEVDNLRCV